MRARSCIPRFALAICLTVSAWPAEAHLTGVFAYFVKDLDTPTATSRLLRGQLDSAAERIAELKPALAEARRSYAEQAEAVLKRLRFYDVYSGSAVSALWTGAQDVVDVLASMTLMQRRIDSDIQALTDLEERYADIRLKEQSLGRYQDLLRAYETSSRARDAHLAELPEGTVPPFGETYVAYEIAEAWEMLRPTTFINYFDWMSRRLEENLGEVLEPSGPGSWQLSEDALNTLVGGDTFPFVSDARLFIRADHVNFSARLKSGIGVYHVLTIGQFERTGPTSVQYRIEGIFLEGMPIDPNDPDVQREVYRGDLLSIDVGPLLSEGSRAGFELHNGYLLFREI